MGYTREDVLELRAMTSDERDQVLATGDKLLAACPERDGTLASFAAEVGISVSVARERRRTSAACDAATRAFLRECGVHISYSALREGSRIKATGEYHDPDFQILRTMATAVRTEGGENLTVARYQHALGLGPSWSEVACESEHSQAVDDFLSELADSPERETILEDLLARHEWAAEAVDRASEQRRRQRQQTPVCGGDETAHATGTRGKRPEAKAAAFTYDLDHLSRQATGLMNRYTGELPLTDDQYHDCAAAARNLRLLLDAVKAKTGIDVIGSSAAHIPAQRRARASV